MWIQERTVRDVLIFLSGPFVGRATIEGATVTLHKVTQEDAGEYRCEISASLDTVSLGETNITLKVLGTIDWKNKHLWWICFPKFFSCLLTLWFSAPTHPILRNPQRSSNRLSGAAALSGPAEHPTRYILLVQGQPSKEPSPSRQRDLSNQLAHGHAGETVLTDKEKNRNSSSVCWEIFYIVVFLQYHCLIKGSRDKDASVQFCCAGSTEGSYSEFCSRTIGLKHFLFFPIHPLHPSLRP